MSKSHYSIVSVLDEPPHLTIGPLMIWVHRRAYPFIDNWTDRNWLQTTTSFIHSTGTHAWTGPDAASDELLYLRDSLQELLDGASSFGNYYPSFQVFTIKFERVGAEGLSVVIEHEDGGLAEFYAGPEDLQRWIIELSAILHFYPKVKSQSPIGEPYVSVRHPDHFAPQLNQKMF